VFLGFLAQIAAPVGLGVKEPGGSGEPPAGRELLVAWLVVGVCAPRSDPPPSFAAACWLSEGQRYEKDDGTRKPGIQPDAPPARDLLGVDVRSTGGA
jgi:hypothetical protein